MDLGPSEEFNFYQKFQKPLQVDVPEVINELKERAPALSAWLYIAMWGVADMTQRMKEHPDNPRFSEIKFPHTEIPLFTEQQAKQLEDKWKETPFLSSSMGQTGGSSESIFTLLDAHAQKGGGLGAVKKSIKKVGTALGTVVGDMNPEIFSLDNQFQTFNNTLDSLDAEVADFSKQYGLMALESVAPDPKFVIPLGPVAIPIQVPIKLVLPTINIILEALRVFAPKIPLVGSMMLKPLSLLLALLDLARGNLYHSIFSFIGIFGKYPMYAGILLKIARDAFLLISPNLRSELRSVLFKSSKSFVVGFFMWLFTMVSPEIIRRPIVKLLDMVRNLVETYNEKAERLSEKATLSLKGVGKVRLPQMPSDKIPTFSDLYILQEYIQMPQVYCHPQVHEIVQGMRSIPPLALFFDLLNIPRKESTEWKTACAEVESKPLAEFLKPTVELTPPS